MNRSSGRVREAFLWFRLRSEGIAYEREEGDFRALRSRDDLDGNKGTVGKRGEQGGRSKPTCHDRQSLLLLHTRSTTKRDFPDVRRSADKPPVPT